MRTFRITTINCMLLVFILGMTEMNAQTTTSAGAYLQKFNDIYKPIQKDMWDYTSAIAKGKSARNVDKRRHELLATLKTSESSVRRSKAFDGSTSLRDVVADWMAASTIILKEDYEQIMDLEAIAEESYDNMEAYMKAKELGSEHMSEKSKIMHDEVERFALEHDITLLEDDSKLAKKLDKADEVFKYYNQLYLVFFKSYKQEAYLLDALEKNDLSGIEQNKTTLNKYATEGKSDLNAIRNINSDVSVKTACRELLDFYISETKNDIDLMTEFLMEKETFERVKTAFENKKSSQRTKADVNNFNQAVNKMNESSKQYNETINRLNSDRSNKLNNWNKSVDRFLNKYAA